MSAMLKQKRSRDLGKLLLDLILWRLFLPLLSIWFLAIGGVGFFGIKTLEKQQQRTVQSIAQVVESYLEQSGRILDAVSRVAEELSLKDIDAFMGSTWKAYKHFETIYYLDKNNRIKLLVPFDPNYVGLDMSRLSEIQQGEKYQIVISKPFISLRTGEPTVYMIRQLALGGRVVGELNLGAFQDEIVKLRGPAGQDSISILDQSGTLLAHPDIKQVKQQTNLDALKVLLRTPDGASVVYKFAGARVLGSVAKVDRVGWVIVDQIPVSKLLGPYAVAMVITLILSLVIWLTLIWNLRKKLDLHVVAPLVQLSQSTDAIAVGDFSRVNSLASMPVYFNEIKKLADDFMHMSRELQAHQNALLSAQEELIRQEKLAILGRLSGTVSHELRNPLSVMNNAIYLLKLKLPNTDQATREYLDIVKGEIDNATRIIGDLLDFARTRPSQVESSNVLKLIENSLNNCSVPLTVVIHKEIPENLPPVLVDPRQIEQVLHNLIINGIQAMPDGGVLVVAARTVAGLQEKYLEFQAVNMEPGGNFVEITVSDSGVGISPENMSKLFQPLFTTKPKGIGLGLVVCKNLVEANNGMISVTSEFGTGTIFTVILPVAKKLQQV